MKYAIYFKWNDGFQDTFNCNNASDRNLNISEMLKRNEFKEISYRKIYKNGEYGKEIKVLYNYQRV